MCVPRRMSKTFLKGVGPPGCPQTTGQAGRHQRAGKQTGTVEVKWTLAMGAVGLKMSNMVIVAEMFGAGAVMHRMGTCV